MGHFGASLNFEEESIPPKGLDRNFLTEFPITFLERIKKTKFPIRYLDAHSNSSHIQRIRAKQLNLNIMRRASLYFQHNSP